MKRLLAAITAATTLAVLPVTMSAANFQEQMQQQAEQIRKQAEGMRKQAEQIRKQAEKIRTQTFSRIRPFWWWSSPSSSSAVSSNSSVSAASSSASPFPTDIFFQRLDQARERTHQLCLVIDPNESSQEFKRCMHGVMIIAFNGIDRVLHDVLTRYLRENHTPEDRVAFTRRWHEEHSRFHHLRAGGGSANSTSSSLSSTSSISSTPSSASSSSATSSVSSSSVSSSSSSSVSSSASSSSTSSVSS